MDMLPAINACLNALAMLFLIAGYIFIKRKLITAHRIMMTSAFVVSCLFLVLYVTHKIAKAGIHTPYHGQGIAKTLYYLMLASHVLLAMAVPVFAIRLIQLARRGNHTAHRRLARYAWPIWVYVSITGVVIYLLLYHFNPAAAA